MPGNRLYQDQIQSELYEMPNCTYTAPIKESEISRNGEA